MWSFDQRTVDALREETNAAAVSRIREAVQPSGKKSVDAPEVDYLTVEEELKLVRDWSTRAMRLSDHCGFPTNVKA